MNKRRLGVTKPTHNLRQCSLMLAMQLAESRVVEPRQRRADLRRPIELTSLVCKCVSSDIKTKALDIKQY